jgi:hypothetical protein
MQLISSSEWEIVNTKEIPGELAKVLPPGNYKTNRKMNNDFSSIPPLKHLFFVISCAEEKFFVIATDFEHPLSIPGYGLEAKDSSPKRIDVDF